MTLCEALAGEEALTVRWGQGRGVAGGGLQPVAASPRAPWGAAAASPDRARCAQPPGPPGGGAGVSRPPRRRLPGRLRGRRSVLVAAADVALHLLQDAQHLLDDGPQRPAQLVRVVRLAQWGNVDES